MTNKVNITVDICRTITPVIFIFIGKNFGVTGAVDVPLVIWILFAFLWLVLANFIIDQRKYPRLAYIPTSLDGLLITSITFCTGMVNSPAVGAYFLTITVCSTNLKIKQGLFCTVFSIICYVGTSLLVFFNVLPYVNIFDSATQVNLFNLVCASILISLGLVCTHIIVMSIAHEKEKERQAAEEATKAKSQFLANMSHEIRTPMNGVIAAADLALAENLPPTVERYLKIIHSSGHSLLGIINDILDFSKIEAGKLEIELAPFKINELMDKISNLFVNKTTERQIEFLVDIEPNTPMAIISDSLRVQQVITNLVGNALKFTDPGGVVTIGVSELSPPPQQEKKPHPNHVFLKFYTKDSGIGMKSEFLTRLFEPFSQEDASTTRKYGGTGLGLSISQKLVNLMGGQIWAESEPGVGTTFYFTICSELQSMNQEQKLELPDDLKNKKVMVIDDCKENLEIIDKTLTAFGLRVETAPFGADGLNSIATHQVQGTPYDLITLDWIMPELNGLEVAKHIRKELKLSTPIIMLTAFGKETERNQAQGVGIDAFLTKPISPVALFETILDVFGKNDGARQKRKSEIIPAKSQLQYRLSGFRILVAEDNLTNQEIAQAVLEKAGIVSFIANNGQEAVEKVYSTPFDLVLMDIQMPIMDGYEATQLIRKDPRFKDLPIIAMTAHAMTGDMEKCLSAGMNDHVTKPINQETLFKTLWKFLASKPKPPPPKIISTTEASCQKNEKITHEGNELSLPGIDIQTAMHVLKLDWNIFKHILIGFHRHTKDIYPKITQEYDACNFKALRETAHSLKGSAANIGARGLEKAAAALENAVKNNQSTEAIKDVIHRVEPVLKEVLLSLSTLAEGPDTKKTTAAQLDLIKTTELEELLKCFEQHIRAGDPALIGETFAMIRTHIDGTLLSELSEYLADYEYDKALISLDNLVSHLLVETI